MRKSRSNRNADQGWTRRGFLGATAAASTQAIALGGPWVGTPSLNQARAAELRPLGAKQSQNANEAVVLGLIGVGGMGTGLLNIFKKFPDVRIAAVCDVYEPHRLRAKEAAGGTPEVYSDFRKVLDRKDIDAVVIATPDHWHAIPAIMACQAEKDVYCEKPLAYRIAEGQRMVQAAAKHKRVTQLGNLIHAGENYHRMVEIVQSGVLGTITKCRVWMASNRNVPEGLGKPADGEAPAGCDYDFWLGPAPVRPFNPNRFTFNWRYFWDYAGGMLCDFVCHLVDPIHWAMNVEAPVRISASGGRRGLIDNGETPDNLEVIYHYAKGFDLIWSHSDSSRHGFDGRSAGVMFQGTKGALIGHYNDYEIFWEKGQETPLPGPTLPRSPGHHREWINAIKTRDNTSCNFQYAHRLSSVGNLGNMALWSGETLHWDAKSELVTNHTDANKYLVREAYRAPWALPVLG